MRLKNNYLVLFFIVISQLYGTNNTRYNLFPNGDVENVYVNQIRYDGSNYHTHIEGGKTTLPTYWKLSNGASLSQDVKYSGNNAIVMLLNKKDVTAQIYSDHWMVKDPNMPWGLPLVPEKEITVSFYYKTKGITKENKLRASIKLGVIKDLASKEDTIQLSATNEWKLIEKKYTLDKIKWGAEVIFTLPADSLHKGNVWIDNVCLVQQLDSGVNLVKNSDFEKESLSGALPQSWRIPQEDQWVGWVGIQYREPKIVKDESINGLQSLRADVTYGDGSGVAQRIELNQRKIKPIVIEIWSKLDNSISTYFKSYPSYADNYSDLTIYVYHMDGTMQEVNPTFMLGESDHDWDLRRFGFISDKPIKEILLQVTVLGTEPTTSLWVDDIKAYELGSDVKELELRGVDIPMRSVSSKWGKPFQTDSKEISAFNDSENLYLCIPKKNINKDISIYLNPKTKSTFYNHFRYLFDVIKINSDGKTFKGTTFEKQGYTEDGQFEQAETFGIKNKKTDKSYLLTIPFKVLQMNGVPFEPFGFNVKWSNSDESIYWNGNAVNNKSMGRLILAKTPTVRIKNIEFGKRYYYDKNQSQDFISHPQLYAGADEALITLVNSGDKKELEVRVGIKGEQNTNKKVILKNEEERTITLPYKTGLEKLTDINIDILLNGQVVIKRTYPIVVPPTIEIMLDQEYYYTEEKRAGIEINNRYRPIQKNGKVKVEVKDLREDRIVDSFTANNSKSVDTVEIDISSYRVNPLPVQDYEITVTYYDNQGKELGKAEKKFGKINHTERRKLPPIEKLTVDEKGRIVINDNFRFFPIVPSVKKQKWDESIDMGANMLRSHLGKGYKPFEERNKAWEKNAYTMTIGPYRLTDLPIFEGYADSLYNHPGFLGTYGKQFYYWKITPEWIELRKKVESIVRNMSSPRLVIWGHHDISFMYYHNMPKWPISNPPVGYCYVKVMTRPSLGWRNTPFSTKTEMITDPSRFKLAEVNYYVSNHCDEVVPEHFPGVSSLRGDDWHGLRNESYLDIIYGATGLYHWVWAQEGQVQRLRGWFQELNYMWPVFVADDAGNKVEVLPYGTTIDVRLKKWEGKYYLLAANRDEITKMASIRIDGIKGMKVKKLFELNNELSVKNNIIRDEWKKYDVHVYEIEFEK